MLCVSCGEALVSVFFFLCQFCVGTRGPAAGAARLPRVRVVGSSDLYGSLCRGRRCAAGAHTHARAWLLIVLISCIGSSGVACGWGSRVAWLGCMCGLWVSRQGQGAGGVRQWCCTVLSCVASRPAGQPDHQSAFTPTQTMCVTHITLPSLQRHTPPHTTRRWSCASCLSGWGPPTSSWASSSRPRPPSSPTST